MQLIKPNKKKFIIIQLLDNTSITGIMFNMTYNNARRDRPVARPIILIRARKEYSVRGIPQDA